MLKRLNVKMQSGISIYLTLMLMTILLDIALGISTIFIGQTKMIKEMGNSVVAFYAADTGIERVLVDRSDPFDIPETTLSNGAKYQVIVAVGGTENCSALDYCIRSIGSYLGTKRAIEISY